MSKLNWISDENLIEAVQHLLKTAHSAQKKSEAEYEKNVIDPFSALFQISGFEIDFDTWLVSEKTRQAQKTLQNHIGDFHQIILGGVDGWNNMKTGNVIDLVSGKEQIIAEIKNKYNTVTGGSLAGLYNSLSNLVAPKTSIYKGYTAYYVTIIPKKPERINKCFTPSDKEKGDKCAANEKIRIIDGASFYSLVTKDDHALEDLFSVLPNVITNCTGIEFSVSDKDNLKRFFSLAYG